MKKIELKKMNILNFKGIRKLSVEFSKNTVIQGDNAVGKTSIYDSFLWAIFGKDSSGVSNFGIKTFDKENKIIPKIPHEVEIFLLINNKEIVLKRCLSEKWITKRGTSDEIFEGNTTEFFYNNVPCSASDYNLKIRDICDEEIFKLITNVNYFKNLKTEQRRELIMQLTSDITDNYIAEKNIDFKELLKEITGKKIEEYKKEISAKIKKMNDEKDFLPAKIEEIERNIPELKNWYEIEKSIENYEKEYEKISKILISESKKIEEKGNEKRKFLLNINQLKDKKTDKIIFLRREIIHSYNEEKESQEVILSKIERNNYEISNFEQKNKEILEKIKENNEKIEILRNNFKLISSEKFEIDQENFVCQTCKRKFENEKIEQKKQELLENFNKQKSEKLEKINENGIKIKEENNEFQINFQKNNAEIEKLSSLILDLKKEQKNVPEPNITELIEKNNEIIEIDSKILELEEIISKFNDNQLNNDDLIEKQKEINNKILELKIELSKKEIIFSMNERKNELNNQLIIISKEIVKLQGIEDIIRRFNKEKINEVERVVNEKFKITRFKMYDKQINGGEKEICEPINIENGVPLSDLNGAGKINIYLDIINAFVNFYKISAPIFIDNRESYTKIINCESQLINLEVVKGKELTIINN